MRVARYTGEVIDLGTTETTPTIGITDFSKRVTDDFGVTTVVERGFARRMSVKFALPSDQVDAVQQRLADLRAEAASWIADDRFASLNVYGIYKDFSLDLPGTTVSYCTLTVEGLAVSETFTDPGGDPAPEGQASTLQLLQPGAVSGMSLYSTVPEDDYAEWSGGTAYALGARVIKAAAHRIYESAAAANVGNDPAAGTGRWIDIGPTNRWAMFDQALGSVTAAAGSMLVAVEPPAGARGVALLDVDAAQVKVEVHQYGGLLYQRVETGGGTHTFFDLPAATDGIAIVVTLTGADPSTPVSIGTMLVGSMVALGITEASASAAITDYSRKEVDEFGEVTIVERAWAKRMTAAALIRTDAIDTVTGRIAAVRARPSLWIGSEGSNALTVYGFFKDFSIEVGETTSKLSLSIEGLSTAGKVEPFAPGAGSVAWPDVTDPTGTKPADHADVTAENTSKDTLALGGRPATELFARLDAIEAGGGEDSQGAAAARTAAEAARDVAITARTNSEAARDQSQAARDAAATAAEQAYANAQAAQVKVGEAGAFAATASGQATIATQKADAASQSASIAEGSVIAAETARGQAQAFSSIAATSANDAAGSASSAATDAGVSAIARDQAGNANTQAQQAASASAGSASSAAASNELAGQRASAAESSRVDAQTAAGQASGIRDQAATSETNAAGSASVASTQAGLAAEARDAAGGYAGASNTSAGVASAKATESGQSASAAEQSRIAADVASGGAASSAAVSEQRAAVATERAAAASASADLSAGHATAAGQALASITDASGAFATALSATATRTSVLEAAVGGALNPNSHFNVTGYAGGLPSGWEEWSFTQNLYRSPRPGRGGTEPVQMNRDSSPNVGIKKELINVPAGWYVVEAEVELGVGAWQSSGVFLDFQNGAALLLNFGTTPDINGFVHGGSSYNRRTWSVLVHNPGQTNATLHAMGGWEGFGPYSGGNITHWHKCVVRPATAGDLKGIEAVARVEQTEIATADLYGRTSARLSLAAITPGGRAEFTLFSDSAVGAGWRLVGDGEIDGSLTVNGTISSGKLAPSSVSQSMFLTLPGSVNIPYS